MARLFVISCNFAADPYPVYPIGAAMVAAAARAAGHEAKLWDPLALGLKIEVAIEAAAQWRPDLIGLSIRNIDNTSFAGFSDYLSIDARLVSGLQKVAPVVLGGAGFSLFPETLMNLTGAEWGIVGEGETAIADLMNAIAARRAPPRGLLPKRDSGASLSLPSVADEDPELAAFYLREGGMLNVQAKRGCPLSCTYCTYPFLEGKTYRFRPVGHVVDEIERLHRERACDYVAFVDSVFNETQGRWLQIAEELVKRALHIKWMAFMRPARISPDEAALLRRSGLECVEWGTDGTTDATLAGLGKSFRWEEVEDGSRALREAGVRCAHFVIFGGPDETSGTIEQGIANIERLRGDVVVVCIGVRILPGTAIHRRAIDEGVIGRHEGLLAPRFYFSPSVDRERLDARLREAFAGRIDRIYPPNAGGEKIRFFRQMGHHGPIWDLLLRERPARKAARR